MSLSSVNVAERFMERGADPAFLQKIPFFGRWNGLVRVMCSSAELISGISKVIWLSLLLVLLLLLLFVFIFD
jgi:hypothetical protein